MGTIIVLILIVWLVGVVVDIGTLIHLLLVVALVLFIYDQIAARRRL